MKNAVRDAAASAPETQGWTAEDVQRVLTAVGSSPAPQFLDVRRVKGQNMVTFRIPAAKTQTVLEVKYPKKQARASLSLRTLMNEEGIKVPRGMYLVVPVVLAEDDDGLAVVAQLRWGLLKSISEVDAEESDTAAS